MHIIQLQTKPQNIRKTGVKHQIKCSINRTPKQRQERRHRTRHTLAHYSITSVKLQHFTTVKRHSITVTQHHRITVTSRIITTIEKIFFKNMLTNNISLLYNRISSKVSTDEVTTEKQTRFYISHFSNSPHRPHPTPHIERRI